MQANSAKWINPINEIGTQRRVVDKIYTSDFECTHAHSLRDPFIVFGNRTQIIYHCLLTKRFLLKKHLLLFNVELCHSLLTS